MTTIQHYKKNSEVYGMRIGLFSILPDIFVILQRVPFLKRWARNLHNTRQSIMYAHLISKDLGLAFELHRADDLASHPFTYEYHYKKLQDIPRDSIMLYSGGLDSFILWRLLGQPKIIYFKINNRAGDIELRKVINTMKRFNGEFIIEDALKLSEFEFDNAYIPYRNLFFILLASYYSSNIIMSQVLEWAPDKNSKFYNQVEKLSKEMTTGQFQGFKKSKDLHILAPISHLTKTELIDLYLQKGFEANDLTEYSWSCYYSNKLPCGKCSACISRVVAMYNNGLHEPTENIVTIDQFRQRWNIRDFKFGLFKMYLKRLAEFKQYTNKNS